MKKRFYCKCPYCPFISIQYRKVSLHVEFEHPSEEQVVIEHYEKVVKE
jgi:hypothetical protein